MRLGKRYGADRLEAACERAEHLRAFSYTTVKNILASAQDRIAIERDVPAKEATRMLGHASITLTVDNLRQVASDGEQGGRRPPG